MDKFLTILKYVILFILVILSVLFMYNFIKDNFFHTVKPVEMTIEESTDKKEVEKAIEKQGTNVTASQAEQVSTRIEKIVETREVPVKVVETNVERYKEVVKEEAKAAKADAVIITPAPDETKIKTAEEVKELPKDTTVRLNQYNIKAYPDNLVSVAAFSDGDVEVDYQRKVKVFKTDMYIGPAVKVNTRDGHAAAGIKMTFTF